MSALVKTTEAEIIDPIRPTQVVTSETATILQIIERAASDPRVDVDKLERLMQMGERHRGEAARIAFNEAMAAAQAEMPQVVKRAENSHTKSQYATLEAVGEAIDPIIAKHGFSQSFGTAECPLPGHYRITCRTSRGAHEQFDFADVPADSAGPQGKANKNPTQSFGSTVSYGRRYLTMMIFNVKSRKALPDDDGNAASSVNTQPSADVISDEQAATLRSLISETGANIDGFLKHFKIECLPDLPPHKFAEAVAKLEAKKARAARA